MTKIFTRTVSLALVVILSICSICVHAADVSENKQTDADALKLLEALEIVGENESLNPDDNITRRQFADYTVRLLNMQDFPDDLYKAAFADVSSDDLSFGSLNLLSELGIVKGTGGRFFRPDDVISGAEAVRMLLNALGYSKIADSGRGESYCSVLANRIGLTDGLEIDYSDGLTFCDAVSLLFGALDADYLKNTAVTEKDNSYDKSTILEEIFKVTADRGIVTKNIFTALTGRIGTEDKERIEIDGKQFFTKNPEDAFYLGYCVKYYHKEYKGSDTVREIIAMYPDTHTKTVTVEEKDIGSYKNLTYEYFDASGKNKKAVLDGEYDLIYNNKCSVESFNIGKYIPSSGTVTLIDNNGNGKYDVVFVKDYRYRLVKDYSIVSNTVTFETPDETNELLFINFDGDECDVLFVDENMNISESDGLLYKGIVVSALVSEPDESEKKACEIHISNRQREREFFARVKEISQGNSDEILLNTSEGEKLYELDPGKQSRLNLRYLTAGSEGMFYLGKNGKIFAYENTVETMNFGMLTGVRYNEGKTTVDIVSFSDGEKNYSLDERFRIGLQSGDGSPERSYTSFKEQKKMYNAIEAILSEKGECLVTFSENGGIVKKIEFPVECDYKVAERAEGLHSLTGGQFKSMQFVKEANAFTNVKTLKDDSGIFVLSNNPTLIFLPGPEAESGYLSASEKYPVGSIDDLSSSEWTVNLYSVSTGGRTADVALIYKDYNSVALAAELFAVERISRVSTDDEEKFKLTGYLKNVKKELYCADNLNISELKSGDVIKVNSIGDKLYSFTRIVDYDSENEKPMLSSELSVNDERDMWMLKNGDTAVSNYVNYRQADKYVFGMVYEKLASSMIVANERELESSSVSSMEVTSLKKHDYNLIYDSSTEKWKVASPADIIDYKSAGNKASYIFSWNNYMQFFNLFIYN